jgi:hypothetical protein
VTLRTAAKLARKNSARRRSARTRRSGVVAGKHKWQAREGELGIAIKCKSDVEVLAESYRHAQMRFFVALFDDSLPLGQFVAKSMLVDEYVVAMAFEFLVRSRLDMCLWSENVHFALMLAGERTKKILNIKKKKIAIQLTLHISFSSSEIAMILFVLF